MVDNRWLASPNQRHNAAHEFTPVHQPTSAPWRAQVDFAETLRYAGSSLFQSDDEVVAVRLASDVVPRLLAGPQRSLRVLIADDCHDATDSLALLVRLWGHDVSVAYSGQAALELALATRPDVLLLDIAMPHMDGCELARQARRHATLDQSLLVAVTGYADAAHRQIGRSAGFDRYLVKPVEPCTMEDLLRLEKSQRALRPQ